MAARHPDWLGTVERLIELIVGIGITAAGDHLVEEIEGYLASDQPARVFDLAENPSGAQR
jgi:hypothetical protein